MLQDYRKTSKIRLKPDGPDDLARNELAAKALAALEELDTHGNGGLPLLLRIGEALSNAKAALKHGEFQPWCRNVLKRSPSWCLSHRRLYEERAGLCRTWRGRPRQEHRWAHCRSVERLVKIIADWERRRKERAEPPKSRRKKRVDCRSSELEEIAAQTAKNFRGRREGRSKTSDMSSG